MHQRPQRIEQFHGTSTRAAANVPLVIARLVQSWCSTRDLEMQTEDALDLRDGLRQVVGAVRAGDDEFGLRAVEVRALI